MIAKLETIYDKINAEREEKRQAKATMSKERKDKLYGKTGVTVVRNESGKLGAILPVGMSAVKLGSIVTKCEDKIEEFKNNNEQKLKL